MKDSHEDRVDDYYPDLCSEDDHSSPYYEDGDGHHDGHYEYHIGTDYDPHSGEQMANAMWHGTQYHDNDIVDLTRENGWKFPA